MAREHSERPFCCYCIGMPHGKCAPWGIGCHKLFEERHLDPTPPLVGTACRLPVDHRACLRDREDKKRTLGQKQGNQETGEQNTNTKLYAVQAVQERRLKTGKWFSVALHTKVVNTFRVVGDYFPANDVTCRHGAKQRMFRMQPE